MQTAVLRQLTRTAAKQSLRQRSSFSHPIMFPGQGAQFVGMASQLCNGSPEAKAMFDRASEILSTDLLSVCTGGPKELLDSTRMSQPAIFVATMAAAHEFGKRFPAGTEAASAAPTVALGISLGEYSALCYAGVIGFEDGVRLTQARGQAMHAACEARRGKMSTVLGLPEEEVVALCARVQVELPGCDVVVGNYLSPLNLVVSGDAQAVDRVCTLAVEQGASKVVPLAVSGAFHSPLMLPAEEGLAAAIARVPFREPNAVPVVMNVDGEAYGAGAGAGSGVSTAVTERIKQNLMSQLTAPVLWERSMRRVLTATAAGDEILASPAPVALSKEFVTAYEVGPGSSCSAILKKLNRRAKVVSVQSL